MKISKEATIIGIIALVFVVAIVVLIWKSPSFVSTTPNQVSDMSALARPTSHMTASSSAKVTMVEFGDYQCPACAAYYPLLKQITQNYRANSNFNFVFRNFPLTQHANAQISAEAAEAAGAQGKYWEMHDMLYENQTAWSDIKDPLPLFVTYAKTIGLDVAKFQQEVSAKKYQSVIDADLADVATLNLDHTPTVFINGEEQTDLSVAALRAKIDPLLAK